MDLKLRFCSNCQYAFLSPAPPADILSHFYADQYGSYTSALKNPGIGTAIQEPAIHFVEQQIRKKWGHRKVRIAEVGGNDGYTLHRLKHLASDVTLIEPSQQACEIAKSFGIQAYSEFLNERLSQELSNRFDVVINRHVLEHVPLPQSFLNQLTELLCVEGLLIVETPDLECVLRDLLVRVVSLQHLHYFTQSTLNILLPPPAKIIDSVIIEKYALIAAVSKETNPPVFVFQKQDLDDVAISFAARLDDRLNNLTLIVQKWVKSGKNIWIWGAGSAAGELFNVYGQDSRLFRGFIDSDPAKSKMRFPKLPNLAIYTPAQAFELGVDAVLIASFSVREIINAIALNKPNKDIEVADIYSCSYHHISRSAL